jgi:predicted transcriptional regulator
MPPPSFLSQLPPLTVQQLEIIDGSLLGDACFHYSGVIKQNCRLVKTQSHFDIRGVDKMDYLEWHRQKLIPYSTDKIRVIKNNYKVIVKNKKITMEWCPNCYSGGYIFATHAHSDFTALENKWYMRDIDGNYVLKNKRRIKIIPHNLKLTPLTICIWYMDDGCAGQKDANLELCTQGFTLDECQFLVERLKCDLGIQSNVKPRRDKFVIYVGRKSYFDFIDMIRPYVEWKCFQYKLDTTTYCKLPHRGETHSGSKLNNQKIMQINQLSKCGVYHKDIAKQMGVSQATVTMILEGRRWQHLTGIQYKPQKPRLSKETKNKIVEMSKSMNQPEIAKILNISQASVSRTIHAN